MLSLKEALDVLDYIFLIYVGLCVDNSATVSDVVMPPRNSDSDNGLPRLGGQRPQFIRDVGFHRTRTPVRSTRVLQVAMLMTGV